jgi:hypothetical protein
MSTAPSYNGLCSPTTIVPNAQISQTERTSIIGAALTYLTRRPGAFRSQSERLAYQKSLLLGASQPGPFLSQSGPAIVQTLRQTVCPS